VPQGVDGTTVRSTLARTLAPQDATALWQILPATYAEAHGVAFEPDDGLLIVGTWAVRAHFAQRQRLQTQDHY